MTDEYTIKSKVSSSGKIWSKYCKNGKAISAEEMREAMPRYKAIYQSIKNSHAEAIIKGNLEEIITKFKK